MSAARSTRTSRRVAAIALAAAVGLAAGSLPFAAAAAVGAPVTPPETAARTASISLSAQCVLTGGVGGIRWVGPVTTPALGSGEFVEVKTTISGPPGFRTFAPLRAPRLYSDLEFDHTVAGREFVPGTYSSTHTVVFKGVVLASTTTRVTCDFRPHFLDTGGAWGTWNYSAFSHEIEWMTTKGITTGFAVPGGREYRPFQPVARDAMAAFLYRLAGSPTFTLPAESPFTDVPTTHPFYQSIVWLADTGISTGWETDDGSYEYRPAAPISRDAMAAFLFRFAEGWPPGYEGGVSFSDVPASSPFFEEIGWLVDNRITFGWDLGSRREFRPYQPITRDAMAAFLFRYAGLRGLQ